MTDVPEVHLPSVPYSTLRLSTRPVDEDNSKRTLEKSVKPTYHRVETVSGESDCSKSFYMDW